MTAGQAWFPSANGGFHVWRNFLTGSRSYTWMIISVLGTTVDDRLRLDDFLVRPERLEDAIAFVGCIRGC